MANPTTSSNFTLGIAQTSQYVQEIWSREVQQPFDKALKMTKLVKNISGLAKGGGDLIRSPFTAAVNARAKSASTDLTFDSPEGAPVVLNIDKNYYVGVKLENIAVVQSNYDMKAAFMERMSESLARQIDTDGLALYASAGTSVSGGAAIDDADILSVLTTFDLANAPISEVRGVVGPYTKGDLLGVNKYTAYDQTGLRGKAVDGSTTPPDSLYGMDLYMSQNVPTSSTGRNLFFHKRAISFAQQQAPKFSTQFMVRSDAWETSLVAIYGWGVERAASVVELTRTTAP